jgi:hypothetical protein
VSEPLRRHTARLRPPRRSVVHLRGELLCNCTRVIGPDRRELNTLIEADFTDAEIEGRRQVREYARFFRDHLAGCEASFVNDTGVQVGVRQTRQARGVALLTNDHVVRGAKFAEGIARSPWPIELHAGAKPRVEWLLDDYYEVPYGCFVPQRGEGLLFAGRCLSAQHEAVASARVTAQCFAYGQAIGHAAAMCIEDRRQPRAPPARPMQRASTATARLGSAAPCSESTPLLRARPRARPAAPEPGSITQAPGFLGLRQRVPPEQRRRQQAATAMTRRCTAANAGCRTPTSIQPHASAHGPRRRASPGTLQQQRRLPVHRIAGASAAPARMRRARPPPRRYSLDGMQAEAAVGDVGSAEALAGGDEIVDAHRQQRAQRNLERTGARAQPDVLGPGTVDVERIPADPDGNGEVLRPRPGLAVNGDDLLAHRGGADAAPHVRILDGRRRALIDGAT